jgi:hypothetical protein
MIYFRDLMADTDNTDDSPDSPPPRSRGRTKPHAPKQKTQTTVTTQSQVTASQPTSSQAAASLTTAPLASASTQSSEGTAPTQSSQKSHRTFALKRGALKVIGYTKDDPMSIKMKVTLPSGEEKLVCK